MADFFSPIRLSDEEYATLVAKLEEAFSQEDAALVINADYGAREIQIVDYSAVELTAPEQEATIWFDQLLFHGMQASSEEVVGEWAAYFDESLTEVAVRRARSLRTDLPSIASAWDAKSAATLPLLGDLRSEVTFNASGEPRIVISFRSIPTRLGGDPDLLSKRDLLVQLLPSDIAYLQAELGYLRDEAADGVAGGDE